MIVNFTAEELQDIKQLAVDKAVEKLATDICYAIMEDGKIRTKLIDEVLSNKDLRNSIFNALTEKVSSAKSVTISSEEEDY